MERQGFRWHGYLHGHDQADRGLEENVEFGQETPQAVSSSLRRRNCRPGREFIRSNRIKVLNVAGSRASNEPVLGNFVKHVLSQNVGEEITATLHRRSL